MAIFIIIMCAILWFSISIPYCILFMKPKIVLHVLKFLCIFQDNLELIYIPLFEMIHFSRDGEISSCTILLPTTTSRTLIIPQPFS